ncbi:MAG TPA: efflux RND transporter periplasmic adaptor subunit [Gammaproteobacteria bacterium]|nr:efflux RND transporter periplasmic adaptor subunit [Gammaproteobacteria bacterium]
MRLFLGILSLLAIIIAIKLFCFHRMNTSKKDSLVSTVDVTYVKPLRIQKYISANGMIKSPLSVDIVSDVSGKILKVLFESGQKVQAGDVLLILDHDIISAEIEQAEAKYAYQRRNYQRFLELSKHGLISKDNIDNLKSQLDQELAQIHSLNAELEKRMIRAPFAGTLGISNVVIGQYIQPAEKIVNLQNTESLMLDLLVPAQYFNTIALGQFVSIEKIENKCGKVEAIDTKIDSHTHSLMVRVQIKNCHTASITGAFVSAFIFTSSDNFLSVPATALNYSLDGTSIFTVRGDIAQQIPVDADISNDVAIIKQGNLHAGDLVISVGQEKIFDGQKIKIQQG